MKFLWAEAPSVAVNVPNQADLLSEVKRRFDQGQGFSIATLNLDHVVKLRNDPAFHEAYGAHSHVTADGNPIVWLCGLAGQTDVSLLPGSELIHPMCALAAQNSAPVGLFGSTDDALAAAASKLRAEHAGLSVAICLSPKMGFDPTGADADLAIEQIRQSGAKLVFLALGAPKQERFAARAQDVLGDVGFVSIGAGLDFIAGTQKRAPVWVRKIAAEWIWRMLQNPKRLAARYGACLLAMPGLTVKALGARRGQGERSQP